MRRLLKHNVIWPTNVMLFDFMIVQAKRRVAPTVKEIDETLSGVCSMFLTPIPFH